MSDFSVDLFFPSPQSQALSVCHRAIETMNDGKYSMILFHRHHIADNGRLGIRKGERVVRRLGIIHS